ncbi:hypothetical protein A8C75_13260 [Marinobacterium aestuarii]|uniref:Uncharacterized protein n=1 Tax=Marinobacterium aestuarii TaxID=1821621 RepID=A0A1A9EZ15_9GAMM|nr:hypothetical protein [Marinobacterium aestuarii]ANG63344.1 hypothetical protein A8C75_13260 [Marinobacterium aestuarii]
MSQSRSAIDTKPYARAGQADRSKILLRCLHLTVGLLGLLAFLLTGLYLYLELPDRGDTLQVYSMLYRANHIYLLCAALLNVQLGCYLSVLNLPLARGLQWTGSLLLLLAPALLLLAIFDEPVNSGPELPYTLPAVIALFAGVTLHAAARVLARRQSR